MEAKECFEKVMLGFKKNRRGRKLRKYWATK